MDPLQLEIVLLGGGIPGTVAGLLYVHKFVWPAYKMRRAIEEDDKIWQNDPAQKPHKYQF